MALIGGLPIFRIFEKSSDFDQTGWLVLTKIQKGWFFQYHDGEIHDEDDIPVVVKNNHGSLVI